MMATFRPIAIPLSPEKMQASHAARRADFGSVDNRGLVGKRWVRAHRLWGMAEFIYTLRNVRKAHGDKVVLDNVTLNFLTGAKIGVVGPNGTGKSPLFKIMAGLDQPSNG